MHRAVLTLALLASLATPASGGLDSLSSLGSWLWGDLLSKEGCGMDPFGRCSPAPQPGPESDAGCGMDPSGCPAGS